MNKKSYLKTSSTEVVTRQVVDIESGEILNETSEIKKHKYLAGRETFYLMYSSLINALKSSKDLKIKVYAYLLENYNFGTEFQLGKPIKKRIAASYDVSESAISNVLTELKKDAFLFSPERGLYRLNSRYAFRGSSKDRNKDLKVLIELGCKDC